MLLRFDEIDDPEVFVRAYRAAVDQLEATTAEPARAGYQQIIDAMRERWQAWTGGDAQELHEKAFGDPLGEY